MSRVSSFLPLVDAQPRVLILGTMPGVASLTAGQYYAHPRNQFWPIMGELVGASPELDYKKRGKRLTAAGIALWDVLKHCRRSGSLDGSIERGSEVPNDIPSLLERHPRICVIAFNGGPAERLFQRLITLPRALTMLRLPSTSPANAGMNAKQKLLAWKVLQPWLA